MFLSALDESKTEIRIQLKDTTDAMLKDTSNNQLVIRIQPDESIRLKMNSKMPGLELRTVGTELDLTYSRTVENPDIPEAYESLLLDALKGDYSDSVSEQELEASWKIFTPLLHEIEGNRGFKPREYAYGKTDLSPNVFICVKLTGVACRFRRTHRIGGVCGFVSISSIMIRFFNEHQGID